MAERTKQAEFWTSLPGLLTGSAAVVTAVAGLILGLYQYGVLGSKQAAVARVESGTASGPAATPAAPRESAGSAALPPAGEAMVTLTASDGKVTPVFADSLRQMRQYDKALHLIDGQNVGFDKIRRIEVVAVREDSARVRLTLANDRVLEGSVDAGSSTLGFHGENELGVFEIRMENLRQVAFPR